MFLIDPHDAERSIWTAAFVRALTHNEVPEAEAVAEGALERFRQRWDVTAHIPADWPMIMALRR